MFVQWMVIYVHACIPSFYNTIITCEQVKIALRSLREVLAESVTAHKAPGNPGNKLILECPLLPNSA